MTSAAPRKSTSARAPRKPADRQKSSEALRQEAINARPEGWELLTPVEELRSADMAEAQADIIELFEKLGVDFSKAGAVDDAPEEHDEDAPIDRAAIAAEFETLPDDVAPVTPAPAEDGNDLTDIKINADTLRAIGGLGKVLEKHALDADEFAAFDRGRGAQQRVMELAMWYLGELGE